MPEPDLQALLRAGITAAKAGQREQARQSLLRVIEQDEASIPAWLWLSTVLDDREERRICLENVLTLDPDNTHARAGLLRLDQPAQEDRKPETHSTLPAVAGQAANRSLPPPVDPPLQVEPKPSVTSSQLRSSRYTRLHPRPPAPSTPPPGNGCPFCRKPISATATLCPHCQLPLVMNCPACGAETDVEQPACPRCGQAMGNYRRKVSYFSSLAAAYQANNHPEDSLKAWQAVQTLEPDYPDLHFYLGKAQMGLGREDRATNSLQRALKENPKSTQAHYALAEMLRLRGEIEEAYPYYLKITQLDPKHGLAWLRLGQLYEQARRSKDALQAYQRAAKLLETGTMESQQVRQQLHLLQPALPEAMMTGWSELIRQMSGPVLVGLFAVLLDSGLWPWWIDWSGWLGLLLTLLGAFLWVSGDSLPRNPLICQLVGQAGLAETDLRQPLALFGLFCWLFAFALIVMPIGQSWPEPPIP